MVDGHISDAGCVCFCVSIVGAVEPKSRFVFDG